jgi:acetoin utilization deacetylase AcuC-like enzyme
MPAGHPERAERIAAIAAHLESCGLSERLDHHAPGIATRELICVVHDDEHVDQLEQLDASGGGRIDLDTAMGPHSFEAARRATQGTVDAVERVVDGEWTSAFVNMRPPGHHATPHRPMGFCLTNHIAIAARWAISTGHASRVAILDWDAHHGNGTQDAFWTDPSVLYVSLHQYPWYPGTGDATERGAGAGAGSTVNVPLPAGAAEDAYTRAFDVVIEPAVRDFEPDLVLVSAGYDAHGLDPLCMMRLSAGAFARMTERVMTWGPGPVCVLEGGYDLDALSWSASATVSALLELPDLVGVPDAEVGAVPGLDEALRWVDRAAALRTAS